MQEFLVRESANNELMVLDTSHFESQMRGYGQQLMKYLDKVNDGVVDKYTVDQIETLMKNFTEVSFIIINTSFYFIKTIVTGII